MVAILSSSYKKIIAKMVSAKWWPFCLLPSMLMISCNALGYIPGLILGLHPANERWHNNISHWLGASQESALHSICSHQLSQNITMIFWLLKSNLCGIFFLQIHFFLQPSRLSKLHRVSCWVSHQWDGVHRLLWMWCRPVSEWDWPGSL